MQGYGACATHACAMQGTHVTCEMQGYITTCLLASTCWLPSPAYWLLPVGFHIYLACLFSLSPAGCRLLASASHLLTCACWLPAPAYCLLPVGFHLQPFHCVLELVIGFSVFYLQLYRAGIRIQRLFGSRRKPCRFTMPHPVRIRRKGGRYCTNHRSPY